MATLVLLLLLGTGARGQDTPDTLGVTKWAKSLDVDLTVTQASYSDSWTGGEAGTFNWVSNANGVFSRFLAPWFRLKNTSKLSFGQTSTQDEETKSWSKPKKSSDKIDIEFLGLFMTKTFVQPFASFRFESQFLDASDEAHKENIDPILLTFSAGIARQLMKTDDDEIMTRLGFAYKHYRNRYYDVGLSADETATTNDGGIESNTDIKLALKANMGYLAKLTVYKALIISDEDKQPNDYWKAVDVNFEHGITINVSKYIKVAFYNQWLYDKQVSKKGRLKEVLALGLTYKLM